MRILEPAKTGGLLGSIERDNGALTEFRKNDLHPDVQLRLKEGTLSPEKLLGWDVDFVPDGKGGVIDGTIKQRITIMK